LDVTKTIEAGKSYTYVRNDKFVAHCLARYESGGVAVHHYENWEGKPTIGSAYLRDEDYEKGLIVEVERPVRGYVNYIYDGNVDEKYLDKQVYVSETLAKKGFAVLLADNPYARLISTIEVKP
jgi:hypothetical protein